MKIRMHRGTYAVSMETEEDIDNTKQAVFQYIERQTDGCHEIRDADQIKVEFYAHTPDRAWETDYIITAPGGVYGFCSEPLEY